MNELQIFEKNGFKIRSMMIGDEPYFVGKDIAKALGYKDTKEAIRDHVREKHKTNAENLGGDKSTPPTKTDCFAKRSWIVFTHYEI